MAFNDLIPWRNNRGLAAREQDVFGSLQKEMNRLFDSFWGGMEPRSSTTGMDDMTGMSFHSPSVDVRETDQAYQVTAELAGLDEGDMEINVRDNSLIISGEKKAEHHEKQDGRYYRERSFGRFQRVIPFPNEIDPGKVHASFQKGVLTIDLPKNAKAQDKARRIPINAGQKQSHH